MDTDTVVKSVAKQLKYYFDVKRLEDGFDLTRLKTSELGRSSPKAPFDWNPYLMRPSVHFEGLHDRSLKHYFSQPEVRAQLTSLEPAKTEERSPREQQIKKSLTNTMKKYQFGKTPPPEWFYIYSLGGPRQQQQHGAVNHRPATAARPRKNAVKPGWPVVQNVPPPDVAADEVDRLVNNASKILLNTGPSEDRPRGQPRARTAHQRYPIRTMERARGDSKTRPLTAKYTWDSSGHCLPSATVRAYSENQADKLPRRAYLRRPQSSSTRLAQQKTREVRLPPSRDSPSPRPVTPRQGRRPRQRQGTIASGTTDHTEDEGVEEVTEGPWAEYKVTVQTGNCIGASTTAAIHLTLYGEKGRSPLLHLATSQYNKVKFQRGKEDLFVVKTPHVGELNKIRIGHDRPELSYAWYLDSMTVHDVKGGEVCQMPCHRWLSGQDEDRQTYCTFVLHQHTADNENTSTSPPPDLKAGSTDSASKPRKSSLTKDTGPAKRPPSRKTSGSKGLGHPQGSRSGPAQRKRDDGKKEAAAERYTRTQSGPSSGSGEDQRGKNRRPKAVEEKEEKEEEEGRKVADYLEGYKAGVEAMEASERQRREEERQKNQQILSSGSTIHDACHKGDKERVTTLLQAFPEMTESTDENGWTPLHIAADTGDVALIKRLTSSNSDNLDTETPTGYTATHLAARNGHNAAVKILNAMGAKMDCTTVDKQTPLHLAAAAGQVECVKCLVAGGADLGMEDAFSRTPQALAEQYGQWAVVDFLQTCQQDLDNPKSSFAQMHPAHRPGRPHTAAPGSSKHKEKESSQREGARPMTSTQRKKAKEDKELEIKREQYEEQHRHMEEEGVSFLDLIRQEMEQEP